MNDKASWERCWRSSANPERKLNFPGRQFESQSSWNRERSVNGL
jgi:hypothetical protein